MQNQFARGKSLLYATSLFSAAWSIRCFHVMIELDVQPINFSPIYII